MPRWFRLMLGSTCIGLGVVGSILPILQGWFFFLLGILILARDIPFFERIAQQLKVRFPKTTAAAERLKERIGRGGIWRIVRETTGGVDCMHFGGESCLSKPRLATGFVGWLIICFAAAWVGSLATPGQWYAELEKPPFNPPDWMFAVIWTILYLLMAVAAWMVWKRKGFPGAAVPLTLFFIQLGLNVAWPWIFFSLQAPGWAFAEIILLWFSLLLTMSSFWIENPPAGALLVPYLGWISYAALINYTIWRMNLGT